MRKLIRVVPLMVVLVAAVFSFVGSPALAAGKPPNQSQFTYKTVEILEVSPARCAELKALQPRKANDLRLCQIQHTEVATGHFITSTGPSPQICLVNATESFQDEYRPLDQEFSMQLNTSWYWGVCGNIPDLTYEDCHVNWTLYVILSDQHCDSYTTSVPSRAALFTAWETFLLISTPLPKPSNRSESRSCG